MHCCVKTLFYPIDWHWLVPFSGALSPLHLRLLSLSKFVDVKDKAVEHEGYLYEQWAGYGSFIYILDTGLDTARSQFHRIPKDFDSDVASASKSRLDIIFKPAREDNIGHGTGVASMIIGLPKSVFHGDKFVIVKMRDRRKDAVSTPGFTTELIRRAFNHIKASGRQGKAVMSMSYCMLSRSSSITS